MSTIKNIGKWKAVVDLNKKLLYLVVEGIIPTKFGEKPKYELKKNVPQGINPTELLLTLCFGELTDPKGKTTFPVSFKEKIGKSSTYKTVHVVDDSSRTIANIKVDVKKKEPKERNEPPHGRQG